MVTAAMIVRTTAYLDHDSHDTVGDKRISTRWHLQVHARIMHGVIGVSTVSLDELRAWHLHDHQDVGGW